MRDFKLHQKTSALKLKLLLGHLIMLWCQILREGTGKAFWWGTLIRTVGAEDGTSVSPPVLASCRPKFGTKLRPNTRLLLKSKWAQSAACLKIGTLKCPQARNDFIGLELKSNALFSRSGNGAGELRDGQKTSTETLWPD